MENIIQKFHEYEVTVEKIVPEGRSLTHINGLAVFFWGGLPGELAKIRIYKIKKSYAVAELIDILKPSSQRIKPKEDHYLICSPWQILNHENQISYKKELLVESFKSMANEDITLKDFYKSQEVYGYRTKIEFSFTNDNDGNIALAFHKRGTNNDYYIIDGCELASEKMNKAAVKITEILNKTQGVEAKGLKSLTIRQSKTDGKILAILMHKFREYDIKIKLSELDGLVDGIIIAYSTIKSPISVVTEIRYQEGKEYLEETILDKTIRYPYDGFFQNNIPMFEIALEKIIENTPKCNKIVEIYSGSGSIGFNIADKAKELVGIEIVSSAVEYAGINKELNNITNYTEIDKPDHKITVDDLINTDILVLDPPRVGVHPKTTKRILEALPSRIIYLSCNPITQARDYALLKDNYKIVSLEGFDFYPNTLHMESLLILDKI
jgi:23S rRNA (uracil1939-C5)-methyltransferase